MTNGRETMFEIAINKLRKFIAIIDEEGIVSLIKGIKRFFIGILQNYSPRFWYWDFLSHFSKRRIIFKHIKGYRMALDLRDRGVSRSLFCFGFIEKFETELIEKVLRKGDTFLDIGANLGYYTLIAAKIVGNEGKVFAFEPESNNFALLKRNVEMNGFKNIVLVKKAISNKSGKAKLFLSKERNVFGGHSLYNNEWLNAKENDFVTVDIITLDEFFKDYDGDIDIIKMDIEGAEGLALQGMQNLLRKNKNVKIFTEFSPIGLKASPIGPKEYLNMLMNFGFKIYEINEEKKKLESIKTYILNMNQTNLLSIKDSKLIMEAEKE